MEERTVGREEYDAIRKEFFERHSAGTEPTCETTYDGMTHASTYRFTDGAAWTDETVWLADHDTDLVGYAIDTGKKAYRTPYSKAVYGETNRKTYNNADCLRRLFGPNVKIIG